MTGLNLEFPIQHIEGAEYNPRKINPDALERLQQSLQAIGCCKPIILRGKTIVAGHQRTRALRALGITHAPVYVLGVETNLTDEIRFNQLHNGTDVDLGDEAASVPVPDGAEGFVTIDPRLIDGNMRATGAPIRGEIMRLIQKYGAWGACVALPTGEIMHAAQYALACRATNTPLLVYVLRADQVEAARRFLPATYGEFCYDSLERHTYIQSFAQPFRMRNEDGSGRRSATYDTLLIPWLEKNPMARVLDFGCGQGDYVRHLQDAGKRIIGVELFRRVKGKNELDIKSVNLMVDALCRQLRTHGRFDAVIADYVLNSIDSQQAEDDVLATLRTFCKTGGKVFLSGRTLKAVKDEALTNIWGQTRRGFDVVDASGMSAIQFQGQWFYQKYHDEPQVRAMADKHGFTVNSFEIKPEHQWRVESVNSSTVIDAGAISREFNMKMGVDGRTLNRHRDVLDALNSINPED